ncbi:hypothetical protein Tco_0890347 [Tanacetum coccineum]|uniref:Reverse transcriptase domain-containing protein n=1 Tax=Tanacetum coccineum TaxID=301880 RepID=A0ABQ5BZS9_9ASTR
MKFLDLHKNLRKLLVKHENDLRSCSKLVPITDLRINDLEEALNIIENKSKVRYSRNRSNASRMNVTSSKTDERIDKLADQLSTLVEIVSKKVVTPAPVKAVEESCVTCGGAHSWYNCPATDNNQASVCATTVFFQNHASTAGTLPSNTIPNPKGEMKAITTRSGVAYEVPSIPTNSSPKKVVEQETKETTDKEQTKKNPPQESTAQIHPPVIPLFYSGTEVLKTLLKHSIQNPILPVESIQAQIFHIFTRDDQSPVTIAFESMEEDLPNPFKICASTLVSRDALIFMQDLLS